MKTTKILVPLALVSAMAFADISATSNVTAGSALSLDSGTIVTSGADLLFSNSSISPQGNAQFYSFGSVGASLFGGITAQVLQSFPYSTAPISGSSLAVGEVFAVKTNASHYAKVLITAASSASVTLQYVNYGATGTGGGNVPSITAVENNYGLIGPG